jgi:1,4-alpha-glucan branching enzyme
MAFPATVTAPSPLADEMGSFLHDGGCTFRVWAPLPAAVSVRLWNAGPAAAPADTPMARDSAAGYGDECWSVFVPGVADGANYRFVVTGPNGSNSFERVDPWGRSVVYPHWTAATRDDSDARSVVSDRTFDWGAPFAAPGWHELVIYQLHVGTFFDRSTGAADPIEGLIEQVRHLRDLGVNAVQFLPFGEFASDLSMGYNSVLPYAIERDYGTPQDFKRLVKALHDAGMRVLIDVVYNHIDVSSNGRVLPYSLFQWDGWDGDPCGVFFYGGDEMGTPWGSPRPNYGRPAVRRYLTDNAVMWLSEYRADGLRFDSTGCVRRRQGPCGDRCCGGDIGVGRNLGWELMQEANDRVDGSQPWKLSIAEDLDGNAAITAPTGAGGAGFDAQWDAGLIDPLLAAVTQPFDESVDVGRVADALWRAAEGDPFKRVIYLESHDQAKHGRVPGKIHPTQQEGWHARRKSMLAAAVAMTAPGIPMMFQGCELLEGGAWSDAVSLDWSRKTRFPRLMQFYADLVRLRTNAAGRTRGLCGPSLNVIQANPSTKVLAYHRWDRGGGADDVVVVANFSSRSYPSYTVGFPQPGTWYVRLNSDANVYSDANDFGSVNGYDTTVGPGGWDGMPCSGNVGLGPFSVLILSR